jgi:predicted nucleotidyltransferase
MHKVYVKRLKYISMMNPVSGLINRKGSNKKITKTYDLENENWIKILKVFFNQPNTPYYISEIARRADLTPRGTQYILESLKRDNWVKNESTDVVNNYWGNYESDKFIGLKRSLNLYSLYSSGLISTLEEYYKTPKCIVLFGSYAKGEDTKKSDIDIAIETQMDNLPDLSVFESKLARTISIQLVQDIKKESDNFKNSLANGIVLSGYLEVV